jgi:DNA modification methylase
MKPYYQDDSVTIYNADCRDVLPELNKVDLLLTDPPYGIGEAKGKNKSRGNLAISKDYGSADWDDKPIESVLLDKLRDKCRTQIIFGGNYYDLPPTSCWLIWDKVNGLTDFADCEMAWTNMKIATRLYRYTWNGMLQENMKNKEIRFHPTQKPLPLMKWCIGKVDTEVNTILDPFMGSGTTLRASKDLGKKAIGIEISEEYCEIAAKRMSQLVMNLEL